jgi:hypothetical protein
MASEKGNGFLMESRFKKWSCFSQRLFRQKLNYSSSQRCAGHEILMPRGTRPIEFGNLPRLALYMIFQNIPRPRLVPVNSKNFRSSFKRWPITYSRILVTQKVLTLCANFCTTFLLYQIHKGFWSAYAFINFLH